MMFRRGERGPADGEEVFYFYENKTGYLQLKWISIYIFMLNRVVLMGWLIYFSSQDLALRIIVPVFK